MGTGLAVQQASSSILASCSVATEALFANEQHSGLHIIQISDTLLYNVLLLHHSCILLLCHDVVNCFLCFWCIFSL